MTLRDQRQKEFAEAFIRHGKFGILNLCPRFGKIRTAINVFNELKPKSILVAYPDKKIEQGWIDDFEQLGFDDSIVTYTTHLSLKKHKDETFDIVVIDEIHLLSEAQIEACQELIENNEVVLGLTGTLSKWTEVTMNRDLNLYVVAEYPIEKAIEEGVVVDYQITVVKVPLDNKLPQTFRNKVRTEKKQFDALSYVIDKLTKEGKDTMFLRLGRMRVIQSSIAKLKKTKDLLQQFKDERVLVFCGVKCAVPFNNI